MTKNFSKPIFVKRIEIINQLFCFCHNQSNPKFPGIIARNGAGWHTVNRMPFPLLFLRFDATLAQNQNHKAVGVTQIAAHEVAAAKAFGQIAFHHPEVLW